MKICNYHTDGTETLFHGYYLNQVYGRNNLIWGWWVGVRGCLWALYCSPIIHLIDHKIRKCGSNSYPVWWRMVTNSLSTRNNPILWLLFALSEPRRSDQWDCFNPTINKQSIAFPTFCVSISFHWYDTTAMAQRGSRGKIRCICEILSLMTAFNILNHKIVWQLWCLFWSYQHPL